MQNNIILIGMPASGKSTVGVLLAKSLGFGFIDTDLLIQQREGMRLEGIIQTKGIDEFLRIEADICLGLTVENTVIATGGSVIYSKDAMDHLKALGCLIYLYVDYDVLEKRLNNTVERGVVLQKGQTIEELYKEREPLYARYADLTVSEGLGALEDTVTAVRKVLLKG